MVGGVRQRLAQSAAGQDPGLDLFDPLFEFVENGNGLFLANEFALIGWFVFDQPFDVE
jgi:hypothetical protein